MGKYSFVYEISRHEKLKTLFFTVLIGIVMIGVTYSVYTLVNNSPTGTQGITVMKSFVENDIKKFTPAGLFYSALIGSFFFIPLPIEAFYIIGLSNGNSAFWSFFLVIAGLLPGHALDYYIGTKFGPYIMKFVSKKKVYKAKRWVNRYGTYAIIFFNILPLPAPVLSFALGLTKYNFARLFTFLVIGASLKFLGINLLYQWLGDSLKTFIIW
ncbi:YqaA family protein [Nanoarchaeota archaeon]